MVLTNKSTQSTVVDKINYGRSFNILKAANADRYLESLSHEDLLRKKLKGLENLSGNTSKEEIEKFLTMMSNIFQSITTLGLTTYEILQYITSALSSFNDPTVIESLSNLMINYISVFHVPYLTDTKYTNDFNSQQKNILNRIIYSDGSAMDAIFGGAISNRSNLNPVPGEYFNTSSFLNFGSGTNAINRSNLVNKNVKSPTKNDPSLSVILLNNDNLRGGTKNSLELSTFFNLIPSLEYSKAYPYFNATFILPSVSRQDKKAVFKTSTLNQFLFGADSSKKSNNFEKFEGKLYKDESGVGVKTNLSVFTTPQTATNMNEKTGHNEILSSDKKRLRITNVHDQTRPFMTLQSFTIDVSPTKGMMSFKTGKMSLVLHDRTRMVDIAPFIKPDLFGAFGAEIVVEYGWSHNESQSSKKSPTDLSKNPIGDFLDSSKCIEKYMIVNSQFTIENNGQVNINLSIAMKGPIDIRQTEIFADSLKSIDIGRLNSSVAEYSLAIGSLTEDKQTAFDFNTRVTGLMTNLEQKRSLKPKARKKIKKTLAAIDDMLDIWHRWKRRVDRNNTGSPDGSYNLSGRPFKFLKKYKNSDQEKKIAFQFLRTKDLETSLKASKFNIIDREVIPALGDIANIIEEFLKFDSNIQKEQRNFIEDLIGGTQFHDMFIDNALNAVIEERGDIGVREEMTFDDTGGLTPVSGFTAINFDQTSVTGPIVNEFKLANLKVNHTKYVSLGTIISSLISTHMVPSKKYDEVQLIFHTVNEKAGLAAEYKNFISEYTQENYRLSIASLLIKRSDLKEYLEKLFENKTRLTLESLISQIVQKFAVTKDNICYGLSDLYTRDAFNAPVKPKKSTKTKTLNDRLNKIYYKNNENLYESEPQFIPPDIHMTFDALTSRNNKDTTICRITVYDRNNNPYQSLSDIYNDSLSYGFKSLRRIRQLLQDAESKKIKSSVKKEKLSEAKRLILELTNGEKAIFERVSGPDGVFFKFKDGFGFNDLKRKYKTIIPAATFATQNTSLINASVATVNEGKLNTVYITRQDRNKTNEINNQVIVDTPLRILPAQASIETFGCPWINFGQYIFLDFETGTTIDNTYAVTGLKHTITPGKFTTQVTLSYGDVYGKYEGAADAFDAAISKLDISSEEIPVKSEDLTANSVKKPDIKNDKASKIRDLNPIKFNQLEVLFSNIGSLNEIIASSKTDGDDFSIARSLKLFDDEFEISIVDKNLSKVYSKISISPNLKSSLKESLIEVHKHKSNQNFYTCSEKKHKSGHKYVKVDLYTDDLENINLDINILISSKNPEEFNIIKNKLYSEFYIRMIDRKQNLKQDLPYSIFNKGIVLKGTLNIQGKKITSKINILSKQDIAKIKYLTGEYTKRTMKILGDVDLYQEGIKVLGPKPTEAELNNITPHYIYNVFNPYSDMSTLEVQIKDFKGGGFTQDVKDAYILTRDISTKTMKSDKFITSLIQENDEELSYFLYLLNILKYQITFNKSQKVDDKTDREALFYYLNPEFVKSRVKFTNIANNFLLNNINKSILNNPTKVTQTTPVRRPSPQPPAQLSPSAPQTTQDQTDNTRSNRQKRKTIIFIERSPAGLYQGQKRGDEDDFLERLRDTLGKQSLDTKIYLYNRSEDFYVIYSEKAYYKNITNMQKDTLRTNVLDIVRKCNIEGKVDHFIFMTNKPQLKLHKNLIGEIQKIKGSFITYLYYHGARDKIESLQDISEEEVMTKLFEAYQGNNLVNIYDLDARDADPEDFFEDLSSSV